ncbi:inovirus-type Gp2 protein [Enterobacter soli]|uniref:YagK/YfjJ domain-containing protein n=1 Tax=Enterobacter soli TaxID=885040 RepID=UPI0037553948
MNHFSPADAANIRAFLQQAVDHYPRLVAFSFTLVLPYRETMADHRSLILRFHTEVWQRMGDYSQARHQERKNSPPTLLRWIWTAASAPECKMVLLMNGDTLNAGQNTQLTDSTLQALTTILSDAWQAVTGTACAGITTVTPLVISRTGRDAFTAPFNQLTTQVKAMTVPITLARTGVIRT